MIRAYITQTAFRLDRAATGGDRIDVERPEGQHRPRASRDRKRMMFKIYVGNLSFDAVESELKELFGQHGEVSDVAIITDRDTGRSRGFGFVEMNDESNATIAVCRVCRRKSFIACANQRSTAFSFLDLWRLSAHRIVQPTIYGFRRTPIESGQVKSQRFCVV